MDIESMEGVPELVSQAFPHEVWRVGSRTLEVEMGTRLRTSLINAAKGQDTVEVTVRISFPDRPRSNDWWDR